MGAVLPKNFRVLPDNLLAKIKSIPTERIEVRTVVKFEWHKLQSNDSAIKIDQLHPGRCWSYTPNPSNGNTSKKNVLGWEVTRDDLPKYTKTFCHEIHPYGDTRRWATACRDREVYHKDLYSPPDHSIEVSVEDVQVGESVVLAFTIEDHFEKSSSTFLDDVLFAVNLLQENFGSVDIVQPNSPRTFFTETLDWELFPPGDVGAVISSFQDSGRLSKDEDLQVATERLELFRSLKPQNFLKGLGGNNTYVGAKYSDDLVVFENLRKGNAIYILYEDWEHQSKLPRSQLLQLSGEKLDRIVHTGNWKSLFLKLMRRQIRKRNVAR